MLMIDYDDVWSRLSPADAVDALDDAIVTEGLGGAPLRSHATNGDQQLLCMPCFRGQGAGVKLITLDPANPDRGKPLLHGVFALFSAPGLEPSAIIDGRALTELRTAAVSGVATRHLARPASERLAIVGAGAQGRSHLRVMHAVLPALRHVDVISRSAGPAEALARQARELGLTATVATCEALPDADVICTCTSSVDPVVQALDLAPGVHVNAVGAYRPDMRELGTDAVCACRVFVETRDAVLAESGDLIIPGDEGRFDATRDVVADLAELVRGQAGREHDDDRTLFKSVGVAFEDLVVAEAILG